MKKLTETADYNTPGSWEVASRGWPEIVSDEAYDFANCAPTIPYGTYVLIIESRLRVREDCLERLKTDFEAAGRPSAEESIKRRGARPKAVRWWP